MAFQLLLKLAPTVNKHKISESLCKNQIAHVTIGVYRTWDWNVRTAG